MQSPKPHYVYPILPPSQGDCVVGLQQVPVWGEGPGLTFCPLGLGPSSSKGFRSLALPTSLSDFSV